MTCLTNMYNIQKKCDYICCSKSQVLTQKFSILYGVKDCFISPILKFGGFESCYK